MTNISLVFEVYCKTMINFVFLKTITVLILMAKMVHGITQACTQVPIIVGAIS